MLPVINSHNSWSRLEEVWLGDTYPAQWYDHLPAETRDVFYHLTEITKEDLQTIQNMIESFGVVVRRPVYENIDMYLQGEPKHLVKPQICPRDQFVTIGNNLIANKWQIAPWKHVLAEYVRQPGCQVTFTENTCLNGANIVRLGKRLIIDTPHPESIHETFLDGYQIELVNNGGHLDGCFAILKPGLILANDYYPDYEKTFPDWKKIFLQLKFSKENGKWWLPSTKHSRSFNEHVIKHAHDWVGNYTETYFELNCLVIDECNVMMLGYNLELEKALNEHGITVHWAPFRTRSFWDGGLHCLTVDIRRNSSNLTQ